MQSSLTQWAAPRERAAQESALAGALSRHLARAHGLDLDAVDVRYRRYTTLKSTARLDARGGLVVCLSEDVRAEPEERQAAIAFVLAARVMGKRPPEWAAQAYKLWLQDPSTRDLALGVRARRARRRTRGPTGRHHDLAPLAAQVARHHFDPPLTPPPVAWTQGEGRAVLASFDEAHEMITVSRLLDHPRVAPDTLRYLLYHELLHYQDFLQDRASGAATSHGTRFSGRRTAHPRSFKERLHRFPGWQDAEKDLARACRRRTGVD